MRWILLGLLTVAACSGLGCGREQQKLEAERRRFVAQAQAELDSLDVETAALRTRLAAADVRVRREAERRLGPLAERRDEVRQEIAALRRSGRAAWRVARARVERGLAALDSLWRHAADSLPGP